VRRLAGLDDVEMRKFLSGLELRPLGRPARSQSPSRLLTFSPVLEYKEAIIFFISGVRLSLLVLRRLLAYCTSPR
jgi:hypothetical protein